MRERRNRTERTSEKKDVKKKFLLVFEGSETEEIYFDAFKEYNQGLSVDVVPLIRSNSEQGFSNPKKMLEMILENIKERQEDSYSYHTLIDWIVDYVKQERLINLKADIIKEQLEKICKEEIEKKLDETVTGREKSETIKKLLEKLRENIKCKFKKVSKEMIDNLIKENDITYYPGIDEIVMIVDRDKNSFTAEQYEELITACNRNIIRLIVTNPCFEFWLLLHFDARFDEGKMLQNAKVKEDVTYCQDVLSRYIVGYQKNRYDANSLMKKINKAIKNEKNYCDDTIGLKNNIGSNVGKLITDIKNSK